jgi:hypothetical protein
MRTSLEVSLLVWEAAVHRSWLYVWYNKYNKKFWEELIFILFLLTVDNIQCHHLHKKFHPKSTNRFKSSTHLRSLNVRHFGMVKVTGLNSMHSR